VLRGEWQDIELIRDDCPTSSSWSRSTTSRDFYRQVRPHAHAVRSEDAGTVAQEATLNGIPCISSNVDGLAETNGGGWW
jgi:hypothetical protein